MSSQSMVCAKNMLYHREHISAKSHLISQNKIQDKANCTKCTHIVALIIGFFINTLLTTFGPPKHIFAALAQCIYIGF